MIFSLVVEILDENQVKFKTLVITNENGDKRLPDWVYDEGYHSFFQVDTEKDQIEWIPAMGPAPCWLAKWSDYEQRRDMIEAVWSDFTDWYREVY